MEELEIPFWNFYKAKRKYRREDEQETQLGQFVQLSSRRYVTQTMPPARAAVKSGKSVKPAEENKRLAAQVEKLTAEKAELENPVSSLKSMMAWFRKKLFGSMSEKNLPIDPSVLEPTLFDMSPPKDEQAALDAEVKKMSEAYYHNL